MTDDAAALVVVGVAGAIYLAIGLYAIYRNQKWMTSYGKDSKQ